MMDKNLLKRATELAKRPYQVQIFADEYEDGEPTYFVRTPEILGCVSHGDTIPEALEWIESARVDFIYFLLEDGLPVPDPQPLRGHLRISMSEFGHDFALAMPDSGAACATILQSQPAVV
ncbi:MAG: type II toxin-antitoxin system HicB family antitoxin [Chloroflexi bacterium]|nr:type II toxin-antitoxin system HicB family antitoxin [Chloroflexota bacterium]